MAYKRLGDILLSVHMITEEQLEDALKRGSEEKKRLGQVLIDTDVITEQQLIDVLKLQLGVESVDLTSVSIPTALAQMVPKNLARKYTGTRVSAAPSTRCSGASALRRPYR